MSGPEPPRAPQGPGRHGDGPAPGDDAPVLLAPREERQVEESVRLVGRAGRGPAVVGALVVGAFLLGLVRPWDLLVPSAADGPPAPGMTAAPVVSGASDGAVISGPDATSRSGQTPPSVPARALTCAFPSQWRTATIEDWNGRQARVWKAATVVAASGPADPAIPLEPIVAATITAIGWCAPIDGADRPPLTLETALYRVEDGIPTPVAHDRLEPVEPDALGELWVPKPRGVGNRPTWPMGRYVIELRSPSGSYVRYLGLELSDRVVRATPGPSEPAASEPAASGPVASEPGLAPAASSPSTSPAAPSP